jgi:5-methyltetrahydrofolate--homocysteine methyltransferase
LHFLTTNLYVTILTEGPNLEDGFLGRFRHEGSCTGLAKEDIVLDAICLAAAGPGSFEVTLQTLRAFREVLNTTTLLGIGNAGFGMPEQTVIDLAYLVGAIPQGLDAALVDPNTAGLLETVRAMDFLAAKDPVGKRYIQQYRRRRISFISTR